MITTTSFDRLAGLHANNNREWFQANRRAIADEVQAPFAALLKAISDGLAEAPVPLRGSAATMFRMNRDVRFSNDKSPYKPSVSGLLTPSGIKAEDGGLMYVQMDQGGGFVACGFYTMPTPNLNALRDAIIARPSVFRSATDDLHASGLELAADMMLKSMPRGYTDHADAWFADYLRRKVLIVRRNLNTEQFMSGAALAEAIRIGRACAQLLKFPDAAARA